jgi:hypothetical protein
VVTATAITHPLFRRGVMYYRPTGKIRRVQSHCDRSRSDRPHCWHERIEMATHFSTNSLPWLMKLSYACVMLHASYSFFGCRLPQSRIHEITALRNLGSTSIVA